MDSLKVLHVLNDLRPSSGPFDRVKAFGEIRPNVAVAVYSKVDEDFRYLLNDVGIEVILLDARKNLDFAAWHRLARLMKKRNFDVIHTHHHFSGILIRVFKMLGMKGKIVHSFGNQFSEFSLVAKVLHTVTFPLVDALVFVSNSSLKSLCFVSKKMMPKNTRVIFNGLNVHEIDREKNGGANLLPEVFRNSKGIMMGNVSRLIAQKDQKTLLLGVAEVIRRGRDVKLIIVGAGNLRTELEQVTEKLGITDHVYFTGFVSRKTVYQILFSLDIFIMTSLWEGLSVALLQAMAAKRAIIATEIPSIKEVIYDGFSGRLIPVKDPVKLADAIEELIQNPVLGKAWGIRARETVEAKFSIKNTAESYSDVYSRLISTDNSQNNRLSSECFPMV